MTAKLPLLISVPHAGLRVPAEASAYCALTPEDVAKDGDEGAAEIYDFPDKVERYVTTDVARAIIDLNRAPDDRRKDGVVKTHTCWDIPVHRQFPPEETVRALLAAHYHPYHARLTRMAGGGVCLGVDCHTMAASGPPVGPDPGAEGPRVCLSNADGTCPGDWMVMLKACFEERFGPHVSVNQPFKGGYITRTHGAEMPWVQVELSRAPYVSNAPRPASLGRSHVPTSGTSRRSRRRPDASRPTPGPMHKTQPGRNVPGVRGRKTVIAVSGEITLSFASIPLEVSRVGWTRPPSPGLW